ncbi:MAG: hypothetical protein ACNA7K_06845 [Acholeplasmataceae bacterium]
MSQSTWYQKRTDKADHLVYLDKSAKELEKLLNHTKTMIIRGAAGKKSPLGGRVKINDHLYFVETGGNLLVTHRALVKDVIETDKMSELDSIEFVKKHQKELNLSATQFKRWAGKKYICLIEISNLEAIKPFTYHREKNMDDWIITDDIESIKA